MLPRVLLPPPAAAFASKIARSPISPQCFVQVAFASAKPSGPAPSPEASRKNDSTSARRVRSTLPSVTRAAQASCKVPRAFANSPSVGKSVVGACTSSSSSVDLARLCSVRTSRATASAEVSRSSVAATPRTADERTFSSVCCAAASASDRDLEEASCKLLWTPCKLSSTIEPLACSLAAACPSCSVSSFDFTVVSLTFSQSIRQQST
mmetsp:Transcript_54482/g.138183  ORF Transcript_54482/g.138183 Transcript_54482/m.138183 type:complete len:208 (+) Transcript_54482:178-801(+)